MVLAVEDSTVRVVVRVRPPTPRELESQRRPAVQVVDERMLVFDPEEPDGGFLGLKWGGSHEGPKKKGRDLPFVFDRVFSEAASQQDVFQHTTRGLLDCFLQGFNCSVFAYGATGAGKTHTMLGREGDPGIMYLTTMELYRRLEAHQEEKQFEVLISYQEVYNEQIHDLLEPKGPLAIREDPDKGVVVQGLSFHQPTSAEQLLEMLTRGNRNRTQHPTDANAVSSRSHAIFQIFVKQQDRVPGLTQALRVAKMSLVDLAGSERASSTHAKGERLREGANINRSLLALVNVLNALADAKGRKSHVPYRDSKLTRLLKDSLGGNCRTVMVAAISPSSLSLEDTYNTLKYASRAKEIKLSLKSNVVSLDCHFSQYATICQQLQAEVATLREKLRVYEAEGPAPQPVLPLSPKIDLPQRPNPSPSHSPSGPGTPQPHPGPVLSVESQAMEAQEEGGMEAKAAERAEEDEEKKEEAKAEERAEEDEEKKEEAKAEERAEEDEEKKEEEEEEEEEASAQGLEQTFTFPRTQSPALLLPSQPPADHLSSPPLGRGPAKQLALRVLRLAQRQFSLLQAANLLTPDMVAEFEALQRLVQEDPGPPEASGKLGPSGGSSLAPELSQDTKPSGYSGPVTRTMAKQLALEVPSGPHHNPVQSPPQPAEKKRRRGPSLVEAESCPGPEQGLKRQRQSFLPCLRRGSLPEAPPPSGSPAPQGGQASSPCCSPRVCPATVIKSRVPLGPSALQNCSTPLVPPARDLNTTFDLSDEPPSGLGFPICQDPSFICSGPLPVFTMRGPKPTTSFPGTSARKKRRIVSASVSRSLGVARRHSRIARLPSSTLKKPLDLLLPQPSPTAVPAAPRGPRRN